MQPENVVGVHVAPVFKIVLDEGIEAGPGRTAALLCVVLHRQAFFDEIFEDWAARGAARPDLLAHLIVDVGSIGLDEQPVAQLIAVLSDDKLPDAGEELDDEVHDGGEDEV